MTKKEAIEFLINTKVYVRNKSEEIQLKLFSLGFEWELGSKSVQLTNKPFIYIHERDIAYGEDVENFYYCKHREITPEDILNITIDSQYRPFKDMEECWQEMLKHQPFGWLKDKARDCYVFLSNISESNDFKFTFNHYIFADNTPFGIKEE